MRELKFAKSLNNCMNILTIRVQPLLGKCLAAQATTAPLIVAKKSPRTEVKAHRTPADLSAKNMRKAPAIKATEMSINSILKGLIILAIHIPVGRFIPCSLTYDIQTDIL